MAKLTFEDWMKEVDAHIARCLGGLSSEDIDDWGYIRAYRAGMKATVAAEKALRHAMS